MTTTMVPTSTDNQARLKSCTGRERTNRLPSRFGAAQGQRHDPDQQKPAQQTVASKQYQAYAVSRCLPFKDISAAGKKEQHAEEGQQPLAGPGFHGLHGFAGRERLSRDNAAPECAPCPQGMKGEARPNH